MEHRRALRTRVRGLEDRTIETGTQTAKRNRLPSALLTRWTATRCSANRFDCPRSIWVIDRPGGNSHQVTFSPHPGVSLADLVHATLVHYKGLDGEPLTAWLWLPKKWQAPGPCVLSFHGGPEGQELPEFRSDYQALLGQGIAVLAPNVRGSGGFGKRFVNLDNQELRFNGIKDIKASVDYLTTNKIADPKRLGIMGGSYVGT